MMGYIDIFISAFLLYGLIRGLYKGFINELASVIGLLLGVYLASKFKSVLSYYLQEIIDWQENYLSFLSFVILLVLTILIVSVAGKLITKVAKTIALGMFNKLLGAGVGLLKNVLILSIIVIVFTMGNNSLKLVEENKLELSIYYKPFNKMSDLISPYVLQKNN
jgi:membrane protein required for colicin V production